MCLLFLDKASTGLFFKKKRGEGREVGKEGKKKKGKASFLEVGWVGVPGSHGFEGVWHLNLKD